MENNFLAINKDYFRMGLKSVDIMLISQVEEYQRNNCKCYVTNKQFSEMFGESESTIKRAIDKLEEMNILNRNTVFIEGNGRGTKQRVVSINKRSKWKVQNEPTKTMEGSNSDNGRFKNEEWKVHNEPIKEKEKDNIKDNLKENENELSPKGEEDWVEGTLYDERLEGIWLTKEEAELLEMNMLTVEEILGIDSLPAGASAKEQFYADEKKRLGSGVTFTEEEGCVRSWLNGACMGQMLIDNLN